MFNNNAKIVKVYKKGGGEITLNKSYTHIDTFTRTKATLPHGLKQIGKIHTRSQKGFHSPFRTTTTASTPPSTVTAAAKGNNNASTATSTSKKNEAEAAINKAKKSRKEGATQNQNKIKRHLFPN